MLAIMDEMPERGTEMLAITDESEMPGRGMEMPGRGTEMPMFSAQSAASEWLAMGLRQLERSVPYYEGLYPEPGTEMLVISEEVCSPVAGVAAIKFHLQWQGVLFTVRVESASGTWMLSSILEEGLCGCTVTVDIDPENDTAMVVAKARTVLGVLMETELSGELEWPTYLPPSGRPSHWPAPPPLQALNEILWC